MFALLVYAQYSWMRLPMKAVDEEIHDEKIDRRYNSYI